MAAYQVHARARTSISFRAFLRRSLKDRTAVGDIARSFATDECFTGLLTPETLRQHVIHVHGADRHVLTALFAAHTAWLASRQ